MAERAPVDQDAVLDALRTLDDSGRGSTTTELTKYLARHQQITQEQARKQVQLALKRGVEDGILRRSGYHYTLTDPDEEGDDVEDLAKGARRRRRRRGGSRSRSRRRRHSSPESRGTSPSADEIVTTEARRRRRGGRRRGRGRSKRRAM